MITIFITNTVPFSRHACIYIHVRGGSRKVDPKSGKSVITISAHRQSVSELRPAVDWGVPYRPAFQVSKRLTVQLFSYRRLKLPPVETRNALAQGKVTAERKKKKKTTNMTDSTKRCPLFYEGLYSCTRMPLQRVSSGELGQKIRSRSMRSLRIS